MMQPAFKVKSLERGRPETALFYYVAGNDLSESDEQGAWVYMSEKPEVVLEARLVPVVEAEGLELVDLEVQGGGRRRFIRLYVDGPEGITVDDCGRISRRVEPLIDAMELFGEQYVLEVSSPGVTRSLKKERDFVRFAGRLARIHLAESVDGRRQWIGELGGVEESQVVLRPLGSEELVRVPLGLVRTARLEYETPQERERRQQLRRP